MRIWKHWKVQRLKSNEEGKLNEGLELMIVEKSRDFQQRRVVFSYKNREPG